MMFYDTCLKHNISSCGTKITKKYNNSKEKAKEIYIDYEKILKGSLRVYI